MSGSSLNERGDHGSPDTYDLVILGSGTAAFAAALRAAEMGKRVVMTEARTLGGTCVNRGCLPSKNLIEAARIVHEIRHPRYPGIAAGKPEVDFAQLVAQKDALVASYRDQKYDSLVGPERGIEVVYGHARLATPYVVEVRGSGEIRRLRGAKILVAVGSSPVIPDVEGLDGVPCITSDLLSSHGEEELFEIPRSLIVIGGGYVGIELGQIFARLGAAVTILEHSEQLLSDGYEPELGPAVRAILEGEGLDIETGVEARRVSWDGGEFTVQAQVGVRERTFAGERLLVAAGRRANTSDTGLEEAGVRLMPDGAVQVDVYLQTAQPHIWAAGDVIGTQHDNQFATPVGAHDARIAVENAFARERAVSLRRIDHRVIPRTIFTDPEIGIVGMTEEQAIAAGHRCWCNTVPMTLVPRANAIRDTRGIIKMAADADTGRLLGVAMIGPHAGEVIHEAAMALRFEATVDDLIDMVHVYPTMAEALKIAAISRYKDPSRLSCCAE